MKRNQLITTCLLGIVSSLFVSCKIDTKTDKPQANASDTLSIEDKDEVVKVNIVDTLTFNLNPQDQEAIAYYNSISEPSEYYEYNPSQLEKTEDRYMILKDLEQFYWNIATWVEKSKIESIDRMIEEIKLNPNSTNEQIKKLERFSAKLKTIVLSRSEIDDQDKIVYDDISTALIDTIIKTGISVPKMKNYQSFNILVSDVDSLHNQAQIKSRVDHVKAIDTLNSFIDYHKVELTKVGINPKPVTLWAY